MNEKKDRFRLLKPSALFVVVALCLVAGFQWWTAREASDERLILKADEMIAHRFVPIEGDSPKIGMEDREDALEPVSIDEEQFARIAKILINFSAEPTACEAPSFEVGVECIRGSARVEVLICLECADIASRVQGEIVRGGYLDNENLNEITGFFGGLFPNDEPIQELLERRLQR